MKLLLRAAVCAIIAWLPVEANAQATLLPPGKVCFQATTGINGMVGVLGTITGGSAYTNGTYGGVALTGGSGTGATANITVSGGAVTVVAILNPGANYVAGDTLSASAASIGGTGAGFSVPVNSIAINSSLAGGTAGMYIPNTLTPKQTWQDSGETILNTNPVALDANGCALIYGNGSYRQILKDSNGNTVWDQVTASTGGNGIFWAGLAGGTPNAVTLTDTAFANQDGYTIQYLSKFENTNAITVSVSGGTPIAVVEDTSSGTSALVSGTIGPGTTPLLVYDATNVEFHLINPSQTASGTATSGVDTPQGYLNLVGQASGNVIQTGDVIGTSTIYYSPYVGNVLPLWNGSIFVATSFSELTATLTAAGSTSNTIQDACVFSNNGTPTLVIGPSWSSVAAGSGARGTGAGSAQLTKLEGIWVNANSIIGYNGLSSYSIPANQCTYIGSISVDSSAGQVTAETSYGQSRKWGIWNAYNRVPIFLQAGDPTAGPWNVASGVSFQAAHNGNTANSLTIFSGLAVEAANLSLFERVGNNSTANTDQLIGIGYNSITAASGFVGRATGNGIALYSTVTATYPAPPSIGINVITALEGTGSAGGGGYFSGTQQNMILSAWWRG